MMKYVRVLHGFEMPVKWALSIVVPIFEGKGDIRNCGYYGSVKLLEHSMKLVERVLENRLCRIVSVNEMQRGFLPERNNRCCIYPKKAARKKCQRKKVIYVHCELTESFYRAPRKVLEWAIRKE